MAEGFEFFSLFALLPGSEEQLVWTHGRILGPLHRGLRRRGSWMAEADSLDCGRAV